MQKTDKRRKLVKKKLRRVAFEQPDNKDIQDVLFMIDNGILKWVCDIEKELGPRLVHLIK